MGCPLHVQYLWHWSPVLTSPIQCRRPSHLYLLYPHYVSRLSAELWLPHPTTFKRPSHSSINMAYRLREGFWDSAAAGLFIVWARDLDEEGRDENGEIPEERRWFVTTAYVDMDKQKCLVSATQKALDGLKFRHKEIFW